MILWAQKARQLTCKCSPGGVSDGMSCGNWRTSLFQDKWPSCVLFFLSQLISYSQPSIFGWSIGVGRRRSCGSVCCFFATTVSQVISEYHLSQVIFSTQTEHKVTAQISLANPEFLDLFLVKLVGGDLAFAFSNGCVENPCYVLQRCPGWPVLGWGRKLWNRSLKVDTQSDHLSGGFHQKLQKHCFPSSSQVQLWAVGEARRSPPGWGQLVVVVPVVCSWGESLFPVATFNGPLSEIIFLWFYGSSIESS